MTTNFQKSFNSSVEQTELIKKIERYFYKKISSLKEFNNHIIINTKPNLFS